MLNGVRTYCLALLSDAACLFSFGLGCVLRTFGVSTGLFAYLDFVVLCFVVSSVGSIGPTCQEIGWEKHPQNDPFCVKWDDKPQSINSSRPYQSLTLKHTVSRLENEIEYSEKEDYSSYLHQAAVPSKHLCTYRRRYDNYSRGGRRGRKVWKGKGGKESGENEREKEESH